MFHFQNDRVAKAIKYWSVVFERSAKPTFRIAYPDIVPIGAATLEVMGEETALLFYVHTRECGHIRIAADRDIKSDSLPESQFELALRQVLQQAGIPAEELPPTSQDLRLSVDLVCF